MAVEADDLPELPQRRPVRRQVVPCGGLVQFARERISVLLGVHFLKVLYPLVVIQFLKVALVFDAGGVSVGIEADSAVRLAERINLPLRVAVERPDYIFQHIRADLPADFKLQVAPQALKRKNRFLRRIVEAVLVAECEQLALDSGHLSPLGSRHLPQAEFQHEIPVDFRVAHGDCVVAQKTGLQIDVEKIVEHRLEKSVFVSGGVLLRRRQRKIHQADYVRLALTRKRDCAFGEVQPGECISDFSTVHIN